MLLVDVVCNAIKEVDEGEVAVHTEAEYLSEKCKKMDLIGKMDQSVENGLNCEKMSQIRKKCIKVGKMDQTGKMDQSRKN